MTLTDEQIDQHLKEFNEAARKLVSQLRSNSYEAAHPKELVALESAQPDTEIDRLFEREFGPLNSFPESDMVLKGFRAALRMLEPVRPSINGVESKFETGLSAQPESKPATLTEDRELAQRFMQEADEGEDSIEELLKQCVSFCRAYFQQQVEPPTQPGMVWQPIETAPKDGTYFIGYTLKYGWHETCWADVEYKNKAYEEGKNIWPFIYWVPLPAAPREGR